MKKKKLIFTLIAIISIILMVIGWFLPETAGMICEIIGATALFVVGIISWIVPSKEKTVFKLLILIVSYLALLSWIIPSATTSGGEISSLGELRVSLYQLIEYPYLSFQFFFQPLLLILAVGGLYGVLSETGKFRNKLEKIAKSLKGKEIVFLVVTSFLLAVINSVFDLNLVLFIFIPMVCGLVLLMGYDKLTAFLVGFISPLIGVIGSTYSYKVVGYINQMVGTDFTTEIVAKVALFLITFLVYIMFLINHAKKAKLKNDEKDEETLSFLGEKKQSKKASWPIFLILGILLVISILGCTKWFNVFEVEAFNNLHETITAWTISDQTVVAYLIEDLKAFGEWSISEMTIMTVLASILLSLIYGLKLVDGLKAFGKGILRVLKPAALAIVAYTVVIITAYHPFIVTVTDWMIGSISNVSGVLGDILYVIMNSLNTILSSILNIDMLYVVQSTVPYLTAKASNVDSLAIITQSMYGLTTMFSPTSTFVLLGLGYLGISYKEWLKSSWKLLLELLIVILIIIFVVVFI